MKMKCGACLVVVMLTGLTPALSAGQSKGTVVRAIQIVEEGGMTRVTIDSDGPLPLPLHEPLQDPPRIYFDLEGVTHKISGPTVAQRGGVVRRVRIALHQVSPPVTRVVLDLIRLQGYSVNNDELQSGRIRVLIGSESAVAPSPAAREADRPAAAPPTPANPSPPPVAPAPIAPMPAPPVPAGNTTPPTVKSPATPAPAAPPAVEPPSRTRSPVLSPEAPRAPLPMREALAYRKQVSDELARIEALRPLMTRIDGGENVGSDTLASAEKEFTDLRRILEAVKPSVALADTHDLLMTSCTFGAMASRFAIEGGQASNEDARRRAASAAAGSLMLFDRACAELGCVKAPQ